MITNIFEFDDKVAADIMTHRTAVLALDGEITLKEALDFVVKEANYFDDSRFMRKISTISSVFSTMAGHASLYRLERTFKYADQKDQGSAQKSTLYSGDEEYQLSLKEMQSQKIHIELVVDEYGQTAGIVTMEDSLRKSSGIFLMNTMRAGIHFGHR